MGRAVPVLDNAKRSISANSLPSCSVKALAPAVGLFSLSLNEAQAGDAVAATAQSTEKPPVIVTGVKLDTFINIDAQRLFGSWEGL